MVCELCGGAHSSVECQAGSPFAQSEQVSYVNQNRNNSYGNSYNPNWRNHLNLSWRNNQNVLRPPMNQVAVEEKSESSALNALTEALTKLTTNQTEFVTETKRFMAETRTNFNNQAAAIRNLEIQVGQIAEKLNGRTQGTWPSNTEINPKECKAVAVVTRMERKLWISKTERRSRLLPRQSSIQLPTHLGLSRLQKP